MGRLFLVYLDGRIYSCRFCHSHLANFEDLVSRMSAHSAEGASKALSVYVTDAFHCRQGKAYLFNTVVNVSAGPMEDRMMTTGLHTVSDIYCNSCCQIVGWKYERAYEKSQKYKEGKFILERARMEGGVANDIFSDSNPASSDPDDA